MYVTKEKTDESCYCKMVPCERLPQRQKVYSSNRCIQKPHCSRLTYCNSALSLKESPKTEFTLKMTKKASILSNLYSS